MGDLADERTSLLHSGTNSCDVTNDPRLTRGSELLGEGDGSTVKIAKTEKNIGRFFIVEITLFAYFLSDYPLTLIMQKYILDWTTAEFTEEDLKHNITHSNETISPCSANISYDDFEFHQRIQSHASMISALESVTRGVPGIFSSLIIGTASDKFGRRIAILPPCVGAMLVSLAIFIVTFHNLPVWYIFIADFLYGLTGSVNGMFMGCTAYITDFTAKERLAIRFGILYFCALIPTILSAEVVGHLVSTIGYSNTALISVAVLAANSVYVAVFFRDRRVVDASNSAASEDGVFRSVWIQLKSAGDVLRGKDTSNYLRSVRLYLLLLTLFFTNIGTSDNATFALFAMNYPLCWGIKMIGIYVGVAVTTMALGIVILMPLQKKFMSENAIAILSMFAAMLAATYKYFVESTWMMFIAPAFGFFVLQVLPCVKSMISAITPTEKQGAVFGLVSVIEVTCQMAAVVILNGIYSATLYISTGFVFLFVALIFGVAFLLLVVHYFLEKKEKSSFVYESLHQPSV